MTDPVLRALRVVERYHDPGKTPLFGLSLATLLLGLIVGESLPIGLGGLGVALVGFGMYRGEQRWRPIDDVPTCRCGERMEVERAAYVDVVRCPTGDCRAEGVRTPIAGLVKPSLRADDRAQVDVLQVGGAAGLVGAAVWVWRLQKVVSVVRLLSIGALTIGGAELVGLIDLTVNWPLASDLAQALIGAIAALL